MMTDEQLKTCHLVADILLQTKDAKNIEQYRHVFKGIDWKKEYLDYYESISDYLLPFVPRENEMSKAFKTFMGSKKFPDEYKAAFYSFQYATAQHYHMDTLLQKGIPEFSRKVYCYAGASSGFETIINALPGVWDFLTKNKFNDSDQVSSMESFG